MDPHHHYDTIRPPPPAADPRQPPPPGQQWYPPSQYQYQPPPPPHNQWGPPPPHPYPQIQIHSQYPPLHPHRPPPHPHPQDWGNTNWGHHPGWEYPARQDEEDWAAKARAWAASKDANDQQHPQYNQKVENNYSEIQSSNPSPGYHPYPANSSAPSSFVPDEHLNYGAKDGRFSGDSNAVYHHPESSSVSSLVHMQEVPSSYSSIAAHNMAGYVETGDGREKLYNSFPFPADSNQAQFHDHLPPPPVGRSVLMEHPHYGANNQAAELPIDLRDQPLNFTRRSSFDHEPIMQNNFHNNNDIGRPVRGVDPGAAPLSHYSFTSAYMPGASYPPFPPIPSSARQHGPSANLTSSFPGNPTPSFGMMSGPGFQSPIPAIGIGSTSGLHPTTGFPDDIYGVSGSDRPKKAPIPDWLKEEIIKNKPIIASSGLARPIDSIEDDTFDKTRGRADQEDSQSVGSPRSAVEEDEEDNMEAVRTAELNKEIKRILTEVLLKVTDDLFDEIATQVLEEDLTTQVANDTVAPDCKPAFAISAISSSKASAKVLVAAQAKEIESGDESEKSISISPGDLLGLASYASDDDEDDSDNNIQNQTSTKKISENDYAAENGNAQAESESGNKSQIHGSNHKKVVSNGVTIHHDALRNVHDEMEISGRSFDGNGRPKSSSITVSEVVVDEPKFEGRKTVEMPGTSKPNNNLGEKDVKSETIQSAGEKISAADESRGGETRNKQDNKGNDTRKSYVGRDSKDKKGVKEEERYERREKTTDKNNDSKEKMKEQGGKYGEKTKESDLKKKSSDHDGKMGRKEKERDVRYNSKDDSDRKRERKKEKEERSRDKHKNELNRHRRRRSSSAGDRGRISKGNSLAGHANCSSDEYSDGSKRKLHRKRRNLSRSPSPSRSRKRQDSQSPPSKRSHRRHSPFSSLETARGRRSRSRSPVRRRR